MKRDGKIAVGALFAATAGYVAGILTAPKSGKETREDIRMAALKAKTESERQIKQLHSELSELIEEGSERAETLKAKARAELDDLVATASVSRQKAREVLSAVRDGETEDEDLDKALKDLQKSIKNLKSYLKKDV